MRAIALGVVLALLIVPTAAFAKGLEVVKQSGDYKATVVFEKNPPTTGKNKVEVALFTNKGAPITDAKVRVEYSMPAMPGMPAMSYKSDATLNGSAYAATIDLSMAGPWDIVVKMAREGKVTSFKLNIDAR